MDWLAGILELIGLWKVGNKTKWGFVYGMSCNIIWIAYVIINQTTYGLLLVVIPAFVINIRNFRKWR